MGSILFSPLKLRGLTLPNRIMVGPMGQYSCTDGCMGSWHLMHLGSLAISGAGLLMLEATAVSPEGRLSPGDPGLWCNASEAALVPILEFCRQHGGARLGMQITHSGRKGSVTVAWEGQRAIPVEDGGWIPRAPSPIPYPRRTMPIMLDEDGMQQVTADFVAATKRADRVGIELLEIHSAHGYLLHNFLSPLTNRRTDAYGGSRENRMRFPLAVFRAVRDAWPAVKPLGVRMSCVDWADGGWTLDDSIAYAEALKAAGCDYATASSGGAVPDQKIEVAPGYQVPFSEAIRRATGICTVAVGLITEPRQAEDILASEKADLVGLARRMLYNPRWPWHAAVELGEEFYYPKQYERAHPSMQGGDFLRPSKSA